MNTYTQSNKLIPERKRSIRNKSQIHAINKYIVWNSQSNHRKTAYHFMNISESSMDMKIKENLKLTSYENHPNKLCQRPKCLKGCNEQVDVARDQTVSRQGLKLIRWEKDQLAAWMIGVSLNLRVTSLLMFEDTWDSESLSCHSLRHCLIGSNKVFCGLCRLVITSHCHPRLRQKRGPTWRMSLIIFTRAFGRKQSSHAQDLTPTLETS